MALVWGGWAGPSGQRERAGIDLSVSGTTITEKYYIEAESSMNDSQSMKITGARSETISFTANTPQAGAVQLVATRTRTGTRGTKYTYSATVTGIYTGATASVSASITVPAAVPSKPAKPTISNISSSAFQINYSYPAGNGAAVTGMRIQVSNVSNFSSFVWNYVDSDGSPAGPYNLEANLTYYVRIAAVNSAGQGPFSDVVTPTTSPLAPLTPSNVVLTRVNDASQTVKWQVNTTGERPVSQIYVNRRDNVNTSWIRVATLAGSATSYTDGTTVANRRYEYIASASNAGGQSGWTVSTAINTTPAAPTEVKAVKSGSNIAVSWKRNATYSGVTQHVIQDNPGGAGWVTVATVGEVNTWTHTGVNASVTHQYRVLAKSTVNAVLDSAWSGASAVVQLLAPPLAPIVTFPQGTVIDRARQVKVSWTHVPVDTTEQTQYQLQWRLNGGAWTQSSIGNATGFTFSYDLPLISSSGTLDVQVRTRGEHATFGPWSAVKTVTLAAMPSVVINAPDNGSTLDQSKVTSAWGYSSDDASPQAQWEATLKQGTSTLETRAGTGTTASVAFNRALSDQQAYTIQVRVRSASGLWSSWDTSSFTTEFPLPVTVEVIPEWDIQAGAVSLTFGELPVPGPGETLPETLDVQRQIGDGDWITIAADLPVDGAVLDPIPSLLDLNRYRAVSKTSLPSSADGNSTEVTWEAPLGGTHFYLNAGAGFGLVCHAPGHTSDDTVTIEQSTHIFAGRQFPVTFYGDHEEYQVTFTGPLIDDATERNEWLALLRARTIVCYRDRLGRRIFGTLSLSLQTSAGLTTVSGTIRQGDYTEGTL